MSEFRKLPVCPLCRLSQGTQEVQVHLSVRQFRRRRPGEAQPTGLHCGWLLLCEECVEATKHLSQPRADCSGCRVAVEQRRAKEAYRKAHQKAGKP